MEEIKKLWERQKEFSDRFFIPENATLEEKQARTKELVLCIIGETEEVLREIKWKTH